MKKFNKAVSLAVVATMISSSLAVTTVQAAVKNNDTSVSSETATQSKVGDGVILHAFNWSYSTIKDNLPAIAAAGYSTVQTSPVQQCKDYCSSMDVGGQWWKLYQPVSMSIAKSSWLGTKAELTELCKEADKYGIKIICDIVSNHMGNETEESPNSISPQIAEYLPDFYNNPRDYFRYNALVVDDSSVAKTVQGHLSKCPDLITNSTAVQNQVISLLKECIDCGVDGFRFDAAKHIETPDDGDYSSDYWPNVTGAASEYYNAKTGKDLYIYGEILNSCGSGRSYSSYTKYINVTDNTTGDSVLYNVVNGKASSASSSRYRSGANASNLVLWAESHDTYEGDSGSAGIANTSNVDDSDIVKAWAIVASRKDSTALYFARPGDALMGEAGTDTTYKSVAVSEINKFHNNFVGQSEKLGSSDNVAYVVRGTKGIVLSNCGGNAKNVSIANTGMADGTYTDTITGNTFKVANGVVTGSIGSTGVAVVYDSTTTPTVSASVESGNFNGDTLTVTLNLTNATSGTYCLENSKPVKFTGKTTIRIGSDYNYGDTINLNLTATDGKANSAITYHYKKNESASSGVYVWLSPENRKTWTEPFYVYIYDEVTDSENTYSNASWPGEQLKYDEATGYYYAEVSANSCLKNGQPSTGFDLAHSANTMIIFGDGTNQYPVDGSKTKLKLNGVSKIFAQTKSTSFTDTDLVPTKVQEDATVVVKDGSDVPTTPVSGVYGDADGDGVVSVQDVTLVQKYLVCIEPMPANANVICDVDADGRVSVQDATTIQKYLVKMDGAGRTGTKVPVPTQPTTAKPTVKPTTAPATTAPVTTVPPTTVASEDYTLYFKTTLGWMTQDGVNLYAYDNATGKSYQFVKDDNDYPNVYKLETPNSVTSVTVYRSLSMVSSKPVAGDTGNVYNAWQATVSATSNCITLSSDENILTGPYVKETKPEFELDRVYFDNSLAKWSNVYIYGWTGSGINNKAILMTQIEGTDLWYYDFDDPLSPGDKCFLFKDTANDWVHQTNDVTIVDGMNCYKAKAANKSTGTWSFISE